MLVRVPSSGYGVCCLWFVVSLLLVDWLLSIFVVSLLFVVQPNFVQSAECACRLVQ